MTNASCPTSPCSMRTAPASAETSSAMARTFFSSSDENPSKNSSFERSTSAMVRSPRGGSDTGNVGPPQRSRLLVPEVQEQGPLAQHPWILAGEVDHGGRRAGERAPVHHQVDRPP